MHQLRIKSDVGKCQWVRSCIYWSQTPCCGTTGELYAAREDTGTEMCSRSSIAVSTRNGQQSACGAYVALTFSRRSLEFSGCYLSQVQFFSYGGSQHSCGSPKIRCCLALDGALGFCSQGSVQSVTDVQYRFTVFISCVWLQTKHLLTSWSSDHSFSPLSNQANLILTTFLAFTSQPLKSRYAIKTFILNQLTHFECALKQTFSAMLHQVYLTDVKSNNKKKVFS